MGDSRDVILTVFACSSQAPCQQWAKKYFTEEPVVLQVPGGGGQQFRAKLKSWAQSGDVFRAALRELAPGNKDIEIRRRALITFSAGWAFADELLQLENERRRLDAYLLLDGCHTQARDHWVEYATRAANLDGAFMVMAHSSITPPNMPSAATTNTDIFKRACAANDASNAPRVTSDIPPYIMTATLPDQGIHIALGASPGLSAISKGWKKDPLKHHDSRGDLTILGYDGNDRPDHVYIAWHVSERLWRWLGELWRAPVAPNPPGDPTLIA